jgi:hypothetical protein
VSAELNRPTYSSQHMTLVLNPSPFDGSLRSYVIGAATSIVSRLTLLHATSVSKLASTETIVNVDLVRSTSMRAAPPLSTPLPHPVIAPMIEQTVEYIEQILQELIAVFPEPSTDLQGKKSVLSSTTTQESLEDAVSINAGNSKVLATPAVLIDERNSIDAMQQASDVGTLKRCIALMKLELVEANVAVQHHRDECDALIASHSRRCEGFEVVKQELSKEILNLRRTALRQEPAIMESHFLTLDIMMLLCGGSSTTAALTDASLRERIEETLAIFVTDVDAQTSVSEDRFQRSLDRIGDLKARLAEADERVVRVGKRMQEQDDRYRREVTTMERKQRDLRQRIADLEQKLQTDKAAWVALERELENVKGDKDALIQAVELAEAKTKQQRQELYVHIATISQQLLAEQKKYVSSFQSDPDPLDVDLVMQIANSGVTTDLSQETLDRMLLATQRPDDPSKLTAQENLADHCDNLRKDVRAWKAVALDSGLQLQLKTVEKTDLEEDLLRVIGFSKDNNLPVPLDLVKSRIEAEHINAFDDNTNFKEICRTLRTDAKVASKRLYEIRLRMQTIVPLAERTAKGETVDEREEEKRRQLKNSAAYARGSESNDKVERDELGSMLEEVNRTEKVESTMRTLLLDNAKAIRQLTLDKQTAEKSKVQERIQWVDQWVKLLGQLPPQVTEQLNLDGLQVLEESDIVLDEFKRIKTEYKDAVEEEKRTFQQHCDDERKKLQTMARDVENAKIELAHERKALATAAASASPMGGGFGSFRRKSSFGGKVDDEPHTSSPGHIALSEDYSNWKPPTVTSESEAQTDIRVFEDIETTTDDPLLYHRRYVSKDVETARVRCEERGLQAHVIGTDAATLCELAPKFDREVANELFASIGQLFQQPQHDRSLEYRQSPPRCGSPAFPRRFLCPSCGESIAQVRPAGRMPSRECQTDPVRRSIAVPRRPSVPSAAPPAPSTFYHVFEALYPSTLSADERLFVGRQVRHAVERHHGVVQASISDETEGCFHLAAFASAADAVNCATSLHEYQRETPSSSALASSPRADRMSLSTSLTQTPRPADMPPLASDSPTARRGQIHMWPRTRNGISSMSAMVAATICSQAHAGETVCSVEALLSNAIADAPIATAYSCVKRTLVGTDEQVWSVVASIHADRRDDFKALPHVEAPVDAGRSRLVSLSTRSKSISMSAVPAAGAAVASGGTPEPETDIDFPDKADEDEWYHSVRGNGDVTDADAQTDPVVIVADEDFHAARGGSRASTPNGIGMGRPSLSATSLRPKPSSATLRTRPSTAGVKKLGDALCAPVRNDHYTDTLLDLWCAIDPFVPTEAKVAPHRAFSADEVSLVPLLSALAALVNLRALIGLKESDTEQLLKVNCITGLQSIFQDLQLTDFTLPVKIPFTVAVRTPGTSQLASHVTAPLLSSTAISDAFRPILHILSRALSTPGAAGGRSGLTSLTLGSRPPTPTEAVTEATKASQQIHAKVVELEVMLKDAFSDLCNGASPNVPIVPPLSPPPLLSAYLGWETVPPPKAHSPIRDFDGDGRGGRSWRPVDSEFTVYDSSGGSPLLAHGLSGNRVGRVVVKAAHPTVSIRKGGVLEGLQPDVTAAGGRSVRQLHPVRDGTPNAASAMGRHFLKPMLHRHHNHPPLMATSIPPPLPVFEAPSGAGGRRGDDDGPTRRSTPAVAAARQGQPRTNASSVVHTRPDVRRADSPMHRTLNDLPSQLPPVSAVAEMFARSFVGSTHNQSITQHPME